MSLKSSGGTPYSFQTTGIIENYVLDAVLPEGGARLEVKEGVAGTINVQFVNGTSAILTVEESNRIIPIIRKVYAVDTTLTVDQFFLCV
jgi:hypothetical protein